ncbi:hypothetical protein HJC23_002422 [Cyclotella cryptica]|uniref:Uncharacterized protein n=1 Tax=Cyclotella cryptica TaxID=29204 RepID=A0ABD3QL31_9STRA|eukprot:CCRYP_004512-RA/>CCRYP_004512-RA protein AED:0.39 eAED:0.40 QI:0/0/0/1/1/1/7/0/749
MLASGLGVVSGVIIRLALLAVIRSHEERVPLRGYECKQNAQRPCQVCDEGFYCPHEHEKFPCGAVNVFCERGSVWPTYHTDGYYTISGDEEHRSDQRPCEPGFYCVGGLKLPCPRGHFCPESAMTAPLECGDPSQICREGSTKPEPVLPGYFSIGINSTRHEQQEAPFGYFARDGILFECAEGHYGNTLGLADEHCSGTCEAGWYCPAASISSRQIACGGSSSPRKVQTGYYTSTEWEPCRPGMYRAEPKNDDISTISPVKQIKERGRCVLCPKGKFKPTPGDSKDGCIECGPKAKSRPDRVTCECHQSVTQRLTKKLYFDVIKKQCLDITHSMPPPESMYPPNSQLTKSKEEKCKPGSYCIDGVRYLCPAGRYGDKELETSSECRPCQAGYYCPNNGSTSPTEIECGAKPNVYCPEGSAVPTYISEGYYANEDDPITAKTSQDLCPPGYYCPGDGLRHECHEGYFGENTGLISETCDGPCKAGYYCPRGSTSSHQTPCGNVTVVCAEGSAEPQLVLSGYYSASSGDNITEELRYAGPNSTQDISLRCEVGFYCKNGVKYQCPGGTHGSTEGASDVSNCRPCAPGFYCPSYPGPPTTNATAIACGQSYHYCPPGSSKPKDIEMGHYGISNNVYPGQTNDEGVDYMDRRTDQVICPAGYFCQQGLRHKCPPGTFGEKSGLVDDTCSGLCPRGYFCPENTVHPLPCSPGAYSTGGAAECTSCDVPLTVSMEKKNRMCRDDRSCCFEIFNNY